MKKRIILILMLSFVLTACGRDVETEMVMNSGQWKAVQTEAVIMNEIEPKQRRASWSMDWDTDDSYILAKIAMAEAEGEDTEGKALVILVVLNRVWNDSFPDTIEEVVMQENQFSPVANGRYDKVQPDDDCYAALDLVMSGWDGSKGALYFESKSDSTWHQEHLKYLFQHGKHYFYTD